MKLVLLSGGMDSAVLLGTVMEQFDAKEVQTLSFEYGAKHNEAEHRYAMMLCEHYKVKNILIPLDFMAKSFKSDLLKTGGEIPEGHYESESMKSTVVPFRNGIMLSIAAGLAESIGADEVLIANHFGDHAIYPDCRSDFIEPMTKAIAAGTYEGIKLVSPFCSWTKAQIAKHGHTIGTPFELTWSCYKGGTAHCGKCGTCVERIEAFKLADIADPTIYRE